MRRLLPLIALAFLVAACGDDTSGVTSTVPTSIDVAGLTEDIDALVTVAEGIRGLEFIVDPVITIVNEEELQPDDLAVSQRLYEILGLLDGTIDLGQAYLDLYAEQVGGYYDNETGEMVIMGGSELSALSRSIVVHELVHALSDQHYGFASLSDDL